MERIAKIADRELMTTIRQVDVDTYDIGLDGQLHRVHCRELLPNLYSLLLGEDAHEVRVSDMDSANCVDAHLYEEGFTIELIDPLKRLLGEAAGRAGDGKVMIESIMPGKVLRILVAEGEAVEAGQPVGVLVAMKMENEIEAPRKGTVQTVHVREGDSVETGETLITIV